MYKYMSDEGALRFVNTLKVRFTQPDDQNDPFEFRPLLDFEGTAAIAEERIDAHLAERHGTVEDTLRVLEEAQSTDPKYPKTVPISEVRKMLSSDPTLKQKVTELAEQARHAVIKDAHPRLVDHMKDGWEKFRQTVARDLGIFCLTGDPTHSPMWAQYANRHYGVLVEFDEHHQWFDQKKTPTDDIRHLEQVTYVQNPKPRTWKEVTAVDMLYTKCAEWNYEREWRIIGPLNDGVEVEPGIFCFDVPPDAVRSIILGLRTTRDSEQKIRAAVAANPHVRFKRATLGGAGKLGTVDAP